CQFGLFSTTFTIESLVDLRTPCPDDLKNLDVFELKDEITLIDASKLFVRGATCDCKMKCATKHCPYGEDLANEEKFKISINEKVIEERPKNTMEVEQTTYYVCIFHNGSNRFI
ncbi:unnamed protein product, partial [Didymodactylos carnosus]